MNQLLKRFTNQYQLSKTLRFELIPQGKTLDFIKEKGLLSQDEQRAQSYKEMKGTIDEFHKYFIDLALSKVKLSFLSDYDCLYNQSVESKKDPKFKDELKKVQDALRKEIVKSFSEGDAKGIFAILDKKELITVELEQWFANQDKKEIYFDDKFKTFTTYFTGFHQNRKNMYSTEANSTAIAYRLIHENLPKFLENAKSFAKINQVLELHPQISNVYKEFEKYLNVKSIDEMFELDYFNEVLSQKGITVYNNIIGGRTAEEGKSKVQGLNEIVNLYNQNKDKKDRLPKLKQLYKQILSDRISLSFLPDAFKDGKQVLQAVFDFYKVNLLSYTIEGQDTSQNLLQLIKQLLQNLSSFDIDKIYLKNDNNLTAISQQLFGDFSVFTSALNYRYETLINPKFELEYLKANEKKRESLDKAKAIYTKQDYFSIAFLQEVVSDYMNSLDDNSDLSKKFTPNCIADYFTNYFIAKNEEDSDKTFDLLANISAKYQCIQGILENASEYEDELKQDQILIDNLKFFLDSIMELVHFIKPLQLKSESITEKDTAFYDVFDNYYETLNLLIPLYNMVRNYVTQKPYSTEKIKLNFENKNNFLGGWVDSKTENSDNATQGGGYLFRKKNKIGEYDFFLGISNDVKLFRSHLKSEITENDLSEFERMDYYQLKSASVFGNSYVGNYEDDKNNLFEVIYNFAKEKNKNILNEFDIYINKQNGDIKPTPSGLFKIVNEKFSFFVNELLNFEDFNNANNLIINNLKQTILSLHRVPKSQTYKDINFKIFTEPIKVIEDLTNEKSFSYFPISKIEFEDVTNRSNNPLFLFKISNKDLSFSDSLDNGLRKLQKRGKDNLHTLYFKALMQGNQNIYDIGTAEIFYRKASISPKNIITHKVNRPINAKNPLTPEAKNTYEYDLIKDKRFTEDKFQFHLSIIQNYKEPKKPNKDINQTVLEYLKNNPEVKIIGLDRGERHLVYLTLIDQKGNILKQESLNVIKVDKHETHYHTLLHNKELERDKARKNWGTIENIKDLKEGYISQVVHKIATMMVVENAIVVMEDLNFGFKRGRFKVEKQIYQKLEKMLIDKLNYLVLKNKQAQELGGLYSALQLTNKFESFQKMGKQSGFIFYVPAWNTSKIDPTTGFVNYFFTKYENVEKAKSFFEKFDSIRFNGTYFEFEVKNYSNFNPKAEGTQQNWTICTHGERIITFRNTEKNSNWDSKTVLLTELFEDFMGKHQIIYGNGECIKTQLDSKNDKLFFEELLNLFKLTLQMRNSVTGTDEDYLISPVKNAQGIFYDSRKADDNLPKDADANGAYHIAKKGLWILEQVNKTQSAEELKKLNLAISNKEWLQYTQQ
ncbi:type V CRISPR-associated protein Cas12a/Cpf1 [Daejeonella sp.]|uniref:type V CRISPR-associated protein Cas12a/Cpf1 n=1 Tax=Daejeonella sp. TaxID=2805397 RepID=UPI0025BE0FBB|nr:type V CRISPR-associated protein Cas12a/Cpf1 [Daejeonella sp.]